MTITARYQSRCGRCGGAIAAGTQIEWERGQKVTHASCPEAPQAPRPGIARSGGRRLVGQCRSRGCSAPAADRGFCRDCAFDEFDD